MKYYNRAIWKKIKEALEIMPVVFLNGPRQVGKSTLMKNVAQDYIKAQYVTFDDIETYASAKNDPLGFLRSFKGSVIIDEVQKAPGIYSSIKLLVDEYRLKDKSTANGRFLLTGSVDISVIPELCNELVGRMAMMSLYPLSVSEALGRGKSVISGLFDQELSYHEESEDFDLDKIIHQASFPETVNMDDEKREKWFEDYINTILQRDVRDLAQIEKISELPNMLKLLANRAGDLLNQGSFASDCGLNHMTYKRYIVLFEKLFLINLLKPWYGNLNLRLVKTPKVFFTDTALLCYLLQIEPSELKQNNPSLYGHLFENFVFSELQKQITLMPSKCQLYFFRTSKGDEVDFIIEKKNGKLIGIEVKSSSTISEKDFVGLSKLKEAVGKDFVRGIVFYNGKKTLPFGDRLVAMPISRLWNLNMDVEIDFNKIEIIES